MALTDKPYHVSRSTVPVAGMIGASASFRDGPQYQQGLLSRAQGAALLPIAPPPNDGFEGGSGLQGGRIDAWDGWDRVWIEESNGLKIIHQEGSTGFDEIGLEGSKGFKEIGIESAGWLETGSLEGANGLETGYLEGAGGLETGSLEGSGGLKIGTLEGSGGLHDDGLGDKTGGKGKGIVKKPPEFHEIICGAPVTGSFNIELLWSHDEWGREFVKTKNFKTEIDGKVWTPASWEDFVNPAGRELQTRATGSGMMNLGTRVVFNETKIAFKLSKPAHTPGCIVRFDRPDPYGKVKKREVKDVTVTLGNTADTLMEAPGGQTIFPEYQKAWLTP